jgi:hypothetical protein
MVDKSLLSAVQSLATTVVVEEISRLDLYSGRDPFTIPQTKIKWVKTSIPGVKTPVLKKRFMYVKVYLTIEGPTNPQIKTAVDQCLRKSAIYSIVAGVGAGYVTGGSAAVSTAMSTFSSTFIACLDAKLGEHLDELLEHVQIKLKSQTNGNPGAKSSPVSELPGTG